MEDRTQFMIKAAIIESAAVSATVAATADTATPHGVIAASHTADALCWAVSVLTAEPMPTIRARVRDQARRVNQPLHGKPTRICA